MAKTLNSILAAVGAGLLAGVCAIGVAQALDGSMIRLDPILTGSVPASAATTAKRQRGRLDGIIAKYANAYGVPVKLAHAVVRVESNYRPGAKGKAGEIGLMQIKPATAKLMGYRGSPDRLFDPDTNIKFGMRYLGLAHQLGGKSVCGTIMKYNAGHGAKKMNSVSSAYCDKVEAHLAE